jgi:hypothetical protein
MLLWKEKERIRVGRKSASLVGSNNLYIVMQLNSPRSVIVNVIVRVVVAQEQQTSLLSLFTVSGSAILDLFWI